MGARRLRICLPERHHNASADSYPLHQLLRDWSEGAPTWTQYSSGSNWQTPGASGGSDLGSTPLGATPGSNTSGNVEKIVLDTAGLQLVSDWVEGTADNFGLILQDYAASDGYQFDSRQGTRPPRLSIDYCESDTVAELPNLAVVKAASPNLVSPGDDLTYTITVTNNGLGDATGVVVTDALSAAVTWVSSTPSQGGCSAPSGVTCELGAIASGDSATVIIVVTVN